MTDVPDDPVSPGSSDTPEWEQWQQLVKADTQYFAARQALFLARQTLLASGIDFVPFLKKALQNPFERGAALRLLGELDAEVRQAVFAELVDLASFSHGLIQVARDAILSLDPAWLDVRLPQEIEVVLQRSASYEEYQRFAELLQQARSPYLATLLSHAAVSQDPDIRDVAAGFQNIPADQGETPG